MAAMKPERYNVRKVAPKPPKPRNPATSGVRKPMGKCKTCGK